MKQFFIIFTAIIAAAGVIGAFSEYKRRREVEALQKAIQREGKATIERNQCILNLKIIDGAVQQWALEKRKSSIHTATISDILPFIKGVIEESRVKLPVKDGNLPACPSGGIYSAGAVSASPTCSLAAEGHSI